LELRQIGQKSAQFGRRLYSADRLAWTLIGLGVFLRVAQYSANRSIWLDESGLALNIIQRSLGGLLQPLAYNQGAPLGFLILEKLSVQAFGSSEYALRLVPLLSGILSLLLFYELARRAIRPGAVPIALGLFAILNPLVYYASEVKPYSSDVAVALAVFASAQVARERNGFSGPRTLAVAVVGALAPWLSYPATFILMGLGTVALMVSYRNRDWGRIGRLAVVAFIWMLSLAVFYYISLRHLRTNQYLLTFWTEQDAFFPLPPSFASVKWTLRTFFNILEYPVGLSWPQIGALLLSVSAIALWTENRAAVLALLLPLFLAAAASAFRLYAFNGRLLLFAVPFIVLLIGDGMQRLVAVSRDRIPTIGVVLAGFLFLQPIYTAGYHLIKPWSREEIRPTVAYFGAHKQPEDVVYVYRNACHAFKYYAYRSGIAIESYVMGLDAHNPADLDRLRGTRRVWIIFSSASKDDKDSYLHHLDMLGTRLDAFESNGAGVYLYDLSRPTKRSDVPAEAGVPAREPTWAREIGCID
jgi:hypothetical protein